MQWHIHLHHFISLFQLLRHSKLPAGSVGHSRRKTLSYDSLVSLPEESKSEHVLLMCGDLERIGEVGTTLELSEVKTQRANNKDPFFSASSIAKYLD